LPTIRNVGWIIKRVKETSRVTPVIFPFRIACSMTYQLSINFRDERMERNRKWGALIILIRATRKEDVTDEKMVD